MSDIEQQNVFRLFMNVRHKQGQHLIDDRDPRKGEISSVVDECLDAFSLVFSRMIRDESSALWYFDCFGFSPSGFSYSHLLKICDGPVRDYPIDKIRACKSAIGESLKALGARPIDKKWQLWQIDVMFNKHKILAIRDHLDSRLN